MKFAKIYSTTRAKGRKVNIGETIIDLAMDEIYKYMGISQEDIIQIEKPFLSNYDGETVILPIVKGYPEHHSISKAFSEKIIPVFLCWTLLDGVLNENDIEYLKKHEPIGCRDEYTLIACQKNGIKAYLNGCITICFPRIKEYNEKGNVYLVDIQPELEKFIPKNILENSKRLTHLMSVKDLYADAKMLLKEYSMARLVVTSRLHVAIPCMAMGVPVIFAKNDFSTRFTWCDRIMPIYDKEQYNNIDWSPEPIEIEVYKKKVFELVSARLKNVFYLETSARELNEFYKKRESRKGITVVEKAIPMIKKIVEKCGENFEYSLWSVSVCAESFYQYIKASYPNAHLIHVYDKSRVLEFHGLITEPIENILKKEYGFLIACPMVDTIKFEMEEFLRENKELEGSYFVTGFPE